MDSMSENRNMRVLLPCLWLVSSSAALAAETLEDWPWQKYGLPRSTTPACIPAKRGTWWPAYHKAMLKREKREGIEILFLGDSITMMWRSQSGYEGGTNVWQKQYAHRNAANFGISGDETEHILWRITAGKNLDGLSPKVLILLIGINNLNRGDRPEHVAEGITTIVRHIRRKLPNTRVLLLGIFPCWQSPKHPVRAKVRRTNEIICKLADYEQTYYLDIGHRFVEPDGTISKEKLRDLIHLSEKGYEIWAEAMEPYLSDLLSNDGKGDVWKK